MAYRRLMHYPPAAHLMALYLMSESEEELDRGAALLKKEVDMAVKERGSGQNIQIIGPVDAGLAKLKDMYRKVLYLKSADLSALLSLREYMERELIRE